SGLNVGCAPCIWSPDPLPRVNKQTTANTATSAIAAGIMIRQGLNDAAGGGEADSIGALCGGRTCVTSSRGRTNVTSSASSRLVSREAFAAVCAAVVAAIT